MNVYHDVARYIMTRENSLDLLAFGNRTSEKPTRVPRWNVRQCSEPLWFPGTDILNFSASTSGTSGAKFSLRSGKGGRLMETCIAPRIKIRDFEKFPLKSLAQYYNAELGYTRELAYRVNQELAT